MKYIEIEWGVFDGPNDYRPKEAEEALRLVVLADSRRSAEETYDKVLSAVGNNYAGTFYPAALRAAEELRELREHSESHWVRWTATEILTDWRDSFRVETGFEVFELPSGERCDVQRQVKSLTYRVIENEDEPRPCPVCDAGPEHSSDPTNMSRSVCFCGHPRYYDYRV